MQTEILYLSHLRTDSRGVRWCWYFRCTLHIDEHVFNLVIGDVLLPLLHRRHLSLDDFARVNAIACLEGSDRDSINVLVHVGARMKYIASIVAPLSGQPRWQRITGKAMIIALDRLSILQIPIGPGQGISYRVPVH